MIRLFLFFLAAVISLAASASDTLYFHFSNPRKPLKDAHGKYLCKAIATPDSGLFTLEYNEKNILVAKGFFSDTSFKHKQYRQQYFNEETGVLMETRTFLNDHVNGIWAIFNEKGDTIWRATVDDGKIVDKKEFPGYKPMDTTQYTKTYTRIDKAAVCSGGRAAWLHYLGTSLSIPKEAIQNNIQGTVVVEFEVTPDGEIQNAHVIQSPNAVLNAEALRLINESPLWEPAEMDGIKVKALIRQPITFRL